MRYGNPSFYQDYKIHDQGVTEVMLFPLYPQHAMASTTTILELAEEHVKNFPRRILIVPAFITNLTIYKTLPIL
jgi:ferrochelatase